MGKYRALYFLEDRAQEMFVKAVVERIAAEESFSADDWEHDVRSARGGSKVLTEFKNFLKDSRTEAPGIDKLRPALLQQLAGLEMLSTSWAQSWFNVKTRLETMTANHHYISYNRYNEICRDEHIRDQLSRTVLLEYLNDLGIVLNFTEFDLSAIHVLEPRWVTRAVYKIINAPQLAEGKGRMEMKHLPDILAQTNPGDYSYPRETFGFIIGLMRKFELCYPFPSPEQTVLVPDLLPIGQPSFAFDYEGSLAFILQYGFLPRSVMPRFIVNMHRDIKANLQWRTGVVLYDAGFQAEAVVKADNDAKRIYIHVAGRGKRDYFAVLLATLRRINQSFQQLKTEELVPMPDDPDITANYKQLVGFERMGVETYITGQNDKEYRIKDLLGTIGKDKATEEEMLAILRQLAEENKENKERGLEKVNSTLLDTLILQPKFLGIGIDIPALLRKLRKKKN